jgi:hypothetical protein
MAATAATTGTDKLSSTACRVDAARCARCGPSIWRITSSVATHVNTDMRPFRIGNPRMCAACMHLRNMQPTTCLMLRKPSTQHMMESPAPSTTKTGSQAALGDTHLSFSTPCKPHTWLIGSDSTRVAMALTARRYGSSKDGVMHSKKPKLQNTVMRLRVRRCEVRCGMAACIQSVHL